MEKEFVLEETQIEVTLSLGVTIYPDDGNKANRLLRNADTAMYKAKVNGKNRYSFYNAHL